MFPVLIAFEAAGREVEIETYQVTMLLAFVLGVYIARREARRAGLEAHDVLVTCISGLLIGLVGARALFVLVNVDEYYFACVDYSYYNAVWQPTHPLRRSACWEALKIWNGGLVYYGGFLGGAVGAFWWARRRRVDLLCLGDVLAPAVALAHAIGRIGCLTAGCCWGKVSNLPWAIRLPAGSMAWQSQIEAGLISRWAETTLPMHPTQTYEALAEGAVFAVLVFHRDRKRFHGEILLLYLFAYAVLRSIIEVFRGDSERGALFEWGSESLNRALGFPAGSWVVLSTSQFVSVLVGAVALGLAIFLRQRRSHLAGE